MQRRIVKRQHYFKLTITSAIVSVISILLAYSLKYSTEFLEHKILNLTKNNFPYLLILLPTIGITAIYFLRKYIFFNRKNKGITEIYKTLDDRKEHLPFFKIPSHYINGFLTVIFGGSTGIEVSTVVYAAAVGNQVYEKEFSARRYKRELICAGVTAGIAVLFTSPLAGFFFAMEVIARKYRHTLLLSCGIAALLSGFFIYFFDNSYILPFRVEGWEWYALPFMLVLSLFGGALSVYFTLLVTRLKSIFSSISNNFIRVNLGALTVGIMLFCFPALYGDSYLGMQNAIENASHLQAFSLGSLLLLTLLKPVAAALTLGAGGDGGVFAPSIVAGAFLGLLFSILCNRFFGTDLQLLNFALIGAAATLSASIYAPLTTLLLICNLLPNGFGLFFPVLLACLVATAFSKKLLPYNVYSYHRYLGSKS